MRAFFTACGWTLAVPPDLKQRLKLYTLLHRFPALRLPHKDATEGPSLDAILEAVASLRRGFCPHLIHALPLPAPLSQLPQLGLQGRGDACQQPYTSAKRCLPELPCLTCRPRPRPR